MKYTSSLDGITPDQLRGLFVGWRRSPSPETHYALLATSDHVVLAVDESGRVVGFVTAITDGILSAYIPFVEVLPEFQHRGVGHALIEAMLETLSKLYMVDLTCDVALQPFYARHGMKRSNGMMLRRYGLKGGIAPHAERTQFT